eukprot:3464605-Ditylum_brightwellii.AAC.1
MERNKQIEHVDCDKDNDVDDGVDDGDCDSVGNGGGGVYDGDDSADKHLIHLLQAADCCLMERRKQIEHVICNVDDDVDNGVDDGVDNGNDDDIDNSDDVDDYGADKHLTHLSQAAD